MPFKIAWCRIVGTYEDHIKDHIYYGVFYHSIRFTSATEQVDVLVLFLDRGSKVIMRLITLVTYT